MNPFSRKKQRDAVAKHWDHATQEKRVARTMWWESRRIREHINRTVSGKTYPRFSQGLLEVAKAEAKGRSFAVGVSVGCGIATKEIAVLGSGLVDRFILFELSTERIKKATELAESKGLLDRVEFRSDDAFSAVASESVDFVHWNNSLHHMMDVDAAVSWSRDVLKDGGMFYMDDYVGPTRWQWSDESLELVKRVRAALPQRYLRNPYYPQKNLREFLPAAMPRPSAAKLEKEDPSEAADSARIIESIQKYFPEAGIIKTGGLVYHLALRQILSNFDEDDEQDRALLDELLILDEQCIHNPRLDNHYAVALAIKGGQLKSDSPLRDRKLIQGSPSRQSGNENEPGPTQGTNPKPSIQTPDAAAPALSAGSELPFQCPVCEERIPAFLPFGVQNRPGARCPKCGALERHRVLWLYLKNESELFRSSGKRLLHIAPEKLMAEKLQQIPGIDYLSADLDPNLAMVQMDLTDIHYPESSFDYILCSHVLEHIPDDRKAMREMYRVLTKGGWLIVMVPIHKEPTYEDFSITTEEGRLAAFGQKDHVRRYGIDLKDRLAEAGFDVSVVDYAAAVPADLRKLYNLRPREIFVCKK